MMQYAHCTIQHMAKVWYKPYKSVAAPAYRRIIFIKWDTGRSMPCTVPNSPPPSSAGIPNGCLWPGSHISPNGKEAGPGSGRDLLTPLSAGSALTPGPQIQSVWTARIGFILTNMKFPSVCPASAPPRPIHGPPPPSVRSAGDPRSLSGRGRQLLSLPLWFIQILLATDLIPTMDYNIECGRGRPYSIPTRLQSWRPEADLVCSGRCVG